MEVAALPDAATFLRVAAPVLERNPAANNLLLGIAQRLVDHPDAYHEAFFWVAEHQGKILGAAVQTPPYPAVIADPLDDGAIPALVATLAEERPELPGVTANEPWGTRFADAWTAATGASSRLAIAQGVFVLTSVEPYRPASGAPRPATQEDRELLVAWFRAFEQEALQETIRDEDFADRDLSVRLGSGAKAGVTLWEDEGAPVCLTGWGRIPGGARIGPVYTPPERRGRGYASSLVAHVSSEMLSLGAEACFLYTDLANPTSNAIYRRLGYEQIAESAMFALGEG
jgi:predicted GNAT family acetyltransferase